MSIRNNLDEIVNIDIEISTPASSDESFSNILIVISGPDATSGDFSEMSGVTAISEAKELTDYGYTTEHPAYIAATVAFSQSPSPDVVYVVERQENTGEGSEEYETLSTTLDRALEDGSWYGLALESTFSTKAEIEEAIKWTEANAKVFGFTITDVANIPSITNYFRSYGMYAGNVPNVEKLPEENNYAALALMAKCFGYQPGSETWALKALAAISPSQLSKQLKKQLEDANITYFTTFAGKNITNSEGGKVLGNEWVDVIRFRDWLKNDMQVRVFNFLTANPKVPFTDGGITGVQSAMEESLSEGQRAGGIAPTEYDEDNNEVPGYTTSVPTSLQLSDTQKASRKLPNCKFSARIAGAIQATDIRGNLKY